MNMNLGPPTNMSNIGGRFNSIPTEQPNPLHMTFQNPLWPPNAITSENVMHYFCDHNNSFYDRTSDNEQLKMQNMGLQNLGSMNQDLTRMNGIQYVLHSASPPLFVICKHKRNGPMSLTPLCYYYVLNGIIYQAPDLYTNIQSRLVGAVEPLKKALQQTLEMSRFNVTKGYYWDFKTEPAKQTKPMDEEGKESRSTRATPYQSVRTEMLLRLLHEQFPTEALSSQAFEQRSSVTGVTSTIDAHQRSLIDSPAFQQMLGQEGSQQNQALDLPQVLPNLPPGASQMANYGLSRLQSHGEELRMDVDDVIKR